MAVGKALIKLMSEVRLGEVYRGKGGPNLPYKGGLLGVRTADVRLTSLLTPEAAEKYLDDIVAARSGDLRAIERLKEFEKVVELPKGEDGPADWPWKIVQQIGGLDIAWLAGREFRIGGYPIEGSYPVRVKNVWEGKLSFNIWTTAKNESSVKLTAEVLRKGIRFDAKDCQDGYYLTHPDDDYLECRWTRSHYEPKTNTIREYTRLEETLLFDLEVSAIISGLFRKIIDNGYLLGKQGR